MPGEGLSKPRKSARMTAPPGEERRLYPRVKRHQSFSYALASNEGEKLRAVIMNISEGGICFLSDMRLPTGSEIIIYMGKSGMRGRILASDPRFNGFSSRAIFLDPEAQKQ